jgi:hypothetical protein
MKKETPKPKKNILLEQLLEESLMIDDHGPVIIGGRNKKPKDPEEEKP